MEIIAKIKGNTSKLAELLESKGLKITTIYDGIIVDLQSINNGKESQKIYSIPKEISRKLTLLIRCNESSTCKDRVTTSCNIICDTSGKPLRPYRIPRLPEVNESGEEIVYAYFSVSDDVVTVTMKDNKRFIILKHSIIRKKRTTAFIKTSTLGTGKARVFGWVCNKCKNKFRTHSKKHTDIYGINCNGSLEPLEVRLYLPERLKHFQEAVEAALEKVHCLSCTHVHYYSK